MGQVAERMGETAVAPATDSASAVAESGASGHVRKPTQEAAAKPAAKPKARRGAAKAQASSKDKPGIVVAPKPLAKKKAEPKASQTLEKVWSKKG